MCKLFENGTHELYICPKNRENSTVDKEKLEYICTMGDSTFYNYSENPKNFYIFTDNDLFSSQYEGPRDFFTVKFTLENQKITLTNIMLHLIPTQENPNMGSVYYHITDEMTEFVKDFFLS